MGFREELVDPERGDLFYDGQTGRGTTDEEWDEQKRRLEADNDHLVPEHILAEARANVTNP